MAIITVSSIADSGKGSLREAISNAQSGDTIRFDSSLTNKKITLTSGQLDIDKNLTIDGTGTENLTISGNKSSRVFYVGYKKDFTLKNLIISDARAVSGKPADRKTDMKGGGIYAHFYATITVENTQFENNVADRGAGIYVKYGGQATVLNSSFDGNDGTPANSGFSGGAIAALEAKGLTVKNSRFTNNKGITGGAIYSLLGPLTVENSVFLNNSGKQGGGAIFTDGASLLGPRGDEPGTIAIRNSWFEGNESMGDGGGLFLYSYKQDKVILEDSTVINNSVSKNSKGNALGGGIRSGVGKLTIRDTIIADNTSEVQGGGLWYDGPNQLTIENTNISGNKSVSENGQDFDAGGGIFINPPSTAPIKISNSTIVDNIAGNQAGALWYSGRNKITLTNSIVAKNTSDSVRQTSFQLKDGGGNIEFPEPSTEKHRVVAGSRIIDPKSGNIGSTGSDEIDQLGAEITPNSPIPRNINSPVPTSASNKSLRYEAEELILDGYKVEIVGGSGASGGKHISLKATGKNQGSATGKFTGEAGNYQVKVGYYDENDGQSKAKVSVAGESDSFKFDRDLPDNWAKSAAKTSRIAIESIKLKSGDTFKIEGTSNKGEFARFDYIEFSPLDSKAGSEQPIDTKNSEPKTNTPIPQSPGNPPPITPIQNQPLRYEAEELILDGYKVEIVGGSGASGGKHISLKETGKNQGSATGKFTGEAGNYQVKVGYYDENDGQSKAKVSVAGESDSFKFDRDLPDDWAKSAAKTSRIAIESVKLKSGDTFKIEGTSNKGEFARFDYIEFFRVEDVQNSLIASNGIIDLRNVDFDGNGKTDEEVSLVLDDINNMGPYNNSAGFYQVLDLDGTVLDSVTNQLLKPGEQGYEIAALNQRVTGLDMSGSDRSLSKTVDGDIFLAPYLIGNGTAEEFIAKNPSNIRQGNGLNAYFGFGNANPDGLQHLKLSNNQFGFEDFYGGGDKDFDDFTFTVDVQST